MDTKAISDIALSISAAHDIAKEMNAMRGDALVNEKTGALLEQLVNAQEALRKLEEAAGEHRRYALVELTTGNFAYRPKPTPNPSGSGIPGTVKPLCYLCQPCFDNGRKVMLKFQKLHLRGDTWSCSVCGAQIA